MDELEKNNSIKEVVEWILCIVIAIVLALLVRHFIGTPTVVQQQSMKGTLEPKDRLILDRLSITMKKEINRGEIITFERPTNAGDGTDAEEANKLTENQLKNNDPTAVYTNEPSNIISKFMYYVLEVGKESYIKRVIAVAGDQVLIKDGKVYLNGEEIEEEYLHGRETQRTGGFYDFTVPEGYVFAMGDNRAASKDCREFGCIPIDKIESKVLIRFWPFDKFGKVQ